MLDKKHRLPSVVVFANIKSFSSQAFLIKEKNNDIEDSRFGIIVSKKIDKKAVVRNKIKRLIRNSIQNFLPETKKGKDILIITRIGVKKKSQDEISELLEKAFKKINLLT